MDSKHTEQGGRRCQGHKKTALQQKIPCSAHQERIASIQESLASWTIQKCFFFVKAALQHSIGSLDSDKNMPVAYILGPKAKDECTGFESAEPRTQPLSIFPKI